MNQIAPEKKIIPRPRQRKVAKAVVENMLLDNPKPLGVVMENNGYGSGAINTPSIVTESAGFKQALRELGLTEELITTSLVTDIEKKPQSRIQELKLGAEILGMVKREPENKPTESKNTYNFIFDANVQGEVRKMEERIKSLLTGNVQENKEPLET